MRFEARFHAPGLKAPERAMPVLGGEAVGPFEIRWFRLIFWRSIAQSLNGFKGKTAGGFLRARASLKPVWTLQSSFLSVCLALNPQTSQLKQVLNITWGTTLAAWQVSGSSLATLAFLQRMPALCRGRNLLELGAGRGLLGIGAAALGGAGEVGVLGWGWGKWWELWAGDGWENPGKMMVYDGKMTYSFPRFKSHHKPS